MERWWLIGAAVLVAVLAAAAAAWWAWWFVPKRQMEALQIEDPKARADVEDNIRKTIGQMITTGVQMFAGAGVLVGAWLAYTGTQRSIEVSQQAAKAAQTAAHDLLVSQQAAKGFEDLGSAGPDKLMVRIGGIYLLESVMNGSEDYHWPVLQALCAFVRENSRNVIVGSTFENKNSATPSTDVQSALSAIGNRKSGLEARVDLRGTNLIGANLLEADLRGAILLGADLSGAALNGADLSGAILQGADLSGTYLSGSNLSGADLSGGDLNGVNLSGADLSGALMTDVNLGSILTNANLSGAIGVVQAQLDRSCGDATTKLPDGLHIKPCPDHP
jgi:hypothetical protein